MTGQRRRTVGFTLLELLVVVTVIALVAGMAAVRLGRSYQRATLQTAVAQWQRLDSFARDLAQQRRQPLKLVIDASENRLAIQESSDKPVREWLLPGSISIGRVLLPTTRRQFGTQRVTIDRWGRMATYAVRLDSASGQSEWLVFAGLTGQCTRDLKTSMVEMIFDVQTKARPLAP